MGEIQSILRTVPNSFFSEMLRREPRNHPEPIPRCKPSKEDTKKIAFCKQMQITTPPVRLEKCSPLPSHLAALPCSYNMISVNITITHSFISLPYRYPFFVVFHYFETGSWKTLTPCRIPSSRASSRLMRRFLPPFPPFPPSSLRR